MFQKKYFELFDFKYPIKAIEVRVPEIKWFWKFTKGAKKNVFFSKLIFPSFSSKSLSFELFSRKFPNFYIFIIKFMKNNENSLTKKYRHVNAPRHKTVKAIRLKILDCIGKSISELLKKPQLNRRPGSQVISIKKSAFFRDGALTLIPLRPLYLQKV